MLLGRGRARGVGRRGGMSCVPRRGGRVGGSARSSRGCFGGWFGGVGSRSMCWCLLVFCSHISYCQWELQRTRNRGNSHPRLQRRIHPPQPNERRARGARAPGCCGGRALGGARSSCGGVGGGRKGGWRGGREGGR